MTREEQVEALKLLMEDAARRAAAAIEEHKQAANAYYALHRELNPPDPNSPLAKFSEQLKQVYSDKEMRPVLLAGDKS